MSILKIYGRSASRAVRTVWMAQELGLEFDQIDVDFRQRHTRQPEHLAINRAGHIPAIRDGNFSMGESCAINLYLARKHNKLMPTTIQGEAQAIEWSFWVMQEVERPIQAYLYHAAVLPEDQRDQAIADRALEKLDWPFTVINKHLSDCTYLVEDRFSVADLNVAGVMSWGKLARINLTVFPHLQEWLERCLSRPAVPRQAQKLDSET